MSKKAIGFSDSFEERVKLRLEKFDHEIEATLQIKPGTYPELLFSDTLLSGYRVLALTDNEEKELKCTTDSETYILCENKAHNSKELSSKFIVRTNADDKSSTNGIEISLSGFTEWFYGGTEFKLSEIEIKKDRSNRAFKEIIKIAGSNYEISSKTSVSIKKLEGMNYLISKSTTIKIVRVDGEININESQKLVLQIRTLFSLLLALPLSVEYVWFINKDESRKKSFYFSFAGDTNYPFRSPRQCFVQSAMLYYQGKWKEIFDNYFNQPTASNFNNIWLRLVALYSYSDIWDYQILGYVSVLDAYAPLFEEKESLKEDDDDYRRKIEAKLVAEIDAYKKSEKLDERLKILAHYRKKITKKKTTKVRDFNKRVNNLIKKMNEDIKKIINLTDEEWKTIKKLRDKVAHGSSLDLQDERDISSCYPHYLMFRKAEPQHEGKDTGFYLYREENSKTIHVLVVHGKKTHKTLNLTEIMQEKKIEPLLEEMNWPDKSDEETELHRKIVEAIASKCMHTFSVLKRITFKLSLLLIYFVYKDFGFSDKDFALSLNRTTHPFACSVRQDPMHLDKYLELFKFIKLSESDFDLIKNRKKSYINCVIQFFKSNNRYSYDEQLTEEIQSYDRPQERKNYSAKEKVQKILDHIKKRDGSSANAIKNEWMGLAYITYEGFPPQRIYGVYLVTYDDSPHAC